MRERERKIQKCTCTGTGIHIIHSYTHLDMYVCMKPACSSITREPEPVLCDNLNHENPL